ncbi:MAG: hypothetical protein IT214_02805 [Chitinophagaceae bacterium]|nr:hypothetical protein [Chitinophagaceae bacterium]
MNFYFSDVVVGTPTFGEDLPWQLMLILLAVILIEAVVMLLFRLNRFGKVLFHSFLVNLASTVLGFLLFTKMISLNDSVSYLSQWLIFYLATVVIEGLVMMLLYSGRSKGKIWSVTVVMNLASYIFLYILSLL